MLLSVVSTVWGKAWPILVAVLFFGVIIFIHEFGHFSFAKLFHVKVNDFAIGMGPAILKKKKGETLYALRLFPIGGFVNMEGEDDESTDERSFSNKPVWQRFIIVFAGAFFNLVLGLIVVAVMMTQLNLVGTRTIHHFTEGSALANSGLQELDKIVNMDGMHVFSEYDISYAVSRDKDEKMDITVLRDGKKVVINDLVWPTREVDGQKVAIYDIVFVGVKKNPLTIIQGAFLETISIARLVWKSLFDLVSGNYGIRDLSGPIGTVGFIADAAEQTSKTDITPLLSLMAFISINIGVFNLLPIPALDGGRLFFMLIEMVLRRPVPQKYERWVHAIGFILLMIFIAVVSFGDIIKIFRN